jgi:diguanylate cyclase (GGDEF)-like protein
MNNNLAYIDDLTGLGNRRAYKRDVGKYLDMPDSSEKGLFVVVMDLDHFKGVNDLKGHLNGDSLIKIFSDILKSNFQGDYVTIARYGGDEFVAVVRGVKRTDILSYCNKIRQEFFDKRFMIGETKQQITVSIGIAEYPTDGLTADELFTRADEALYTSKHLGRNRVSLAKDSVSQVTEERRVAKALSKPDLVSRDSQIKEAEKILLRDNPRKLTMVRGDIGSGKSRFLTEVFDLAMAKGSKAFLINCMEQDKAKPYSLVTNIIAALSNAGTEYYKEIFSTLSLQQQASLSLIPRLRAFIPDQKNRDPEKRPKIDLFYGTINMLDGLIKKITPIILLDNMDFADESSLEIISGMAMLNKQTPLCICASDSRPPAGKNAVKASFLDAMLDKISEFEIIDRIEMVAFTREETYGMLQAIFKTIEFTPLFADSFYDTTGGNPFFIIELLRDFLERSLIQLNYPRWVISATAKDFPQSLKELLMHKLDRLNTDEKEILFAASGIGTNFRFDFLSKLKKINSGYIRDLVFKSEDINILSPVENAPEDEIYFRNDIVRSAIYNSASEDLRKKLHGDIAEIMVEAEGTIDLEYMSADIAYHFRKADMKHDADKYAEMAVQYADRIFSSSETNKLIDNIINDREISDRLEPVKDESWPLLIMLMKWFNSAVKGMFFYNRPNFITDKAIQNFMDKLKSLFELQSSITISLPEGMHDKQDSILVNGCITNPASIFEQTVYKSMACLMMDMCIGSITFSKNVSMEEINTLVLLIHELNAKKKEDKHWQPELLKKNITGVKIDQVLYRRVLSGEEKKLYRSELIKDTVAAGALIDSIISGSEGAALGEVVDGDKKLFTETRIGHVTREEKNILAKMIGKLDLELIVETVMEEYVDRNAHIQDIKDMVLICIEHVKDKQRFISLLGEKLSGMGMSAECFKWIKDKKTFAEYPIRKRASIYLNEDLKTVLEMSASVSLIPTLKELFALGEAEIAENIIDKYAQSYISQDPCVRGYLARSLEDIMIVLSGTNISPIHAKRISHAFIELLKSEKDKVLYGHMVKHANFIVIELMNIKEYDSAYDIISIDRDEILKNMDITLLCKKIFDCVEKSNSYESIKALIDVLELLGNRCVSYILGFLVFKFSSHITFEFYTNELRLLEMLKHFKDESISQLKEISKFKSAKRSAIEYVYRQL